MRAERAIEFNRGNKLFLVHFTLRQFHIIEVKHHESQFFYLALLVNFPCSLHEEHWSYRPVVVGEKYIFSYDQVSLVVFELCFVIIANSFPTFILFLLAAFVFVRHRARLNATLLIMPELVVLPLLDILKTLQFEAVKVHYILTKHNLLILKDLLRFLQSLT